MNTAPDRNIINKQAWQLCPSCGEQSQFQHIGEQKWSEAIAAKLNLPTIINLYNCGHCHSTVTGLQLER